MNDYHNRKDDGLLERLARVEEKILAADKALELARNVMDHWKAESNNWRKENIDQRGLFLTIDKAQALMATESALRLALEGRVAILENVSNIGAGKEKGLSIGWSLLVGILGIIGIIIGIVNFFQ